MIFFVYFGCRDSRKTLRPEGRKRFHARSGKHFVSYVRPMIGASVTPLCITATCTSGTSGSAPTTGNSSNGMGRKPSVNRSNATPHTRWLTRSATGNPDATSVQIPVESGSCRVARTELQNPS